ncbi:MAG: hypothetical protein WC030_01080 [Candidatus Paceibacterota bacterium]
MIVEFLGAPGAGKTYLLRQVTCAEDVVVKVASKKDALYGLSLFAVRHPLAFCVWCVVLCTYGRSLFRYKTGLVVRAMAARMFAEREDARKMIYIDEGILQRLLTVFDRPLSQREAAFMLRTMPLPDVVVLVRGGDFERFRLAQNRGNSPRVQQGDVALSVWMNGVRESLRAIGAILPAMTRVITCTRGQPDAEPGALRRQIEQCRTMLL